MAKTTTTRERGKTVHEKAKPRSLPTFEWSFHLVPFNEREVCLFYECCREALREEPGDEYRWPPWLHLSKADRKYHVKSRRNEASRRSVRDVAYLAGGLRAFSQSVPEEWLTSGLYPGRAKTLALLEIDWSASNPKLKSDFAQWLVERRAARGSLAFKYKDRKEKPGPKENVNQQLLDLAIYRAKKAGYAAKLTAELLSPLVTGLDKYFNPGELNSQGVYEAFKRAKKLLQSLPI